jgi:hypothetical protein
MESGARGEQFEDCSPAVRNNTVAGENRRCKRLNAGHKVDAVDAWAAAMHRVLAGVVSLKERQNVDKLCHNLTQPAKS